MECYASHLGLWGKSEIVEIPLPPLFSPDLALPLHAACMLAGTRQSQGLTIRTRQQGHLIINMSGLFEENPLMKNCGIILERGKNYT